MIVGGRTAMNEELRNMLVSIYDNLPVGVLVVSKDDEERILYHNKQVLEILQCENEEDFHRCCHDRFSGLYHDEGKASIRHLFFNRHHSESSVIFVSFITLTALGHVRRLECVLNRNSEIFKDYWVLNVIDSSDRNDQMTYSKVSELMTVSEFYKVALRKAEEEKNAGNFEENVPNVIQLRLI
jgi:PAS domain-containing protein